MVPSLYTGIHYHSLQRQEFNVCYIFVQMDQLKNALQERDMTGNQLQIHFKSKMSDKEEESARLKAEINILHEKLSQSSSQVRQNWYLWKCQTFVTKMQPK